MITRLITSVGASVANGVATWTFPPIPMSNVAVVSLTIPQSPATSTWQVSLNGTMLGGMAGTTPFGPLFILSSDTLSISGASVAPAPTAAAVGLIGFEGEIDPLPPTIGGGLAQSMTVNADELQGVGISSSLPSNLQGLVFNGTLWAPANIVNSLASGTGFAASASTGNVTGSAPISNTSPLLTLTQTTGSSSIVGNTGAGNVYSITSNTITFGTSGFTAVADVGPFTGTYLVVGAYRLYNNSGGPAQGQVCFSANSTSVVFNSQGGGQSGSLASAAEEFVSVVGMHTFSGQFLYVGGVANALNAISINGGNQIGVGAGGTLMLQLA